VVFESIVDFLRCGDGEPILDILHFGRVHQTLRVTPAMEAGIADHARFLIRSAETPRSSSIVLWNEPAFSAKPGKSRPRFGIGHYRRGHDVGVSHELPDAIGASLGYVQLHQTAGVQVQRQRRSSSTIDETVLPVILAGCLAPAGLPPFQCACPSATS